MHQQHIVFNGAFERKVRRVGNVGAWREVLAGAEDVARLLLGDRELGDCLEPDAAPAVVVAAPRRDTVEVADIFGLRQREELLPRQREGILDEPADLELPRSQIDLRLLAEIEDGPVLDSCCPTGSFGMPWRFAGPRPSGARP